MARLHKDPFLHRMFLVLGVAALAFWSCAPPPVTMGAKRVGTWWVDVPVDDGVPPIIHVSKTKDQRVIWHTNMAGTLSITWEGANPFPDLKCTGSVCLSGSIGNDVQYGVPYVYHIAIVTAEKIASIDPTIMIDP